MSVMESELKDKEVIMSLLNEPFEDQVVDVEHASKDIESVNFSLLDLLREIWNPEYSASRNLRLLLASVSRYLTTTNRSDCNVGRMREGSNMKSVITELHKLWLKEGPKSPTCSVNEMYNFICDRLPSKLYSSLVSDLMTQDTFYEWIDYRDRYVKSVGGGGGGGDILATTSMDHSYSAEKRDDILATTSTDYSYSAKKRNEKEEEEAGHSGGLEALFDLTETDRDFDRMPQYISRMKDRRMLTVRSSGEIGSQLIRLDIFDVKDIANKEKRDWWRYAKLRSQILTTLSRTDRKRRLLRQFLDQAADDLKKIPGVMKETKNIVYESDRTNV